MRVVLNAGLAAMLASCAAVPPSQHSADLQRYVGVIVRVGEVPTVNTASDAQRNFMGSMYGAVGTAVTGLLATRRGYPVYRVKVSEELELGVPGEENQFAVGDCVSVWFPVALGPRRYFGPGEAGIAKTSGCLSSEK